MWKIIKKFWWIPVAAFLLFWFTEFIEKVNYQNKKIEKFENEVIQLKTQKVQIETEKLKLKKEIESRPVIEIPGKIIIKTVIKEFDKKQYVPKIDYEKMESNRDELFLACEKFQKEISELKRKVQEHFNLDIESEKINSEIITALESEIKIYKKDILKYKRMASRKWGVGFIAGYSYIPEKNIFDWTFGFGIYYKIF